MFELNSSERLYLSPEPPFVGTAVGVVAEAVKEASLQGWWCG